MIKYIYIKATVFCKPFSCIDTTLSSMLSDYLHQLIYFTRGQFFRGSKTIFVISLIVGRLEQVLNCRLSHSHLFGNCMIAPTCIIIKSYDTILLWSRLFCSLCSDFPPNIFIHVSVDYWLDLSKTAFSFFQVFFLSRGCLVRKIPRGAGDFCYRCGASFRASVCRMSKGVLQPDDPFESTG